ncbi:ATP-binding protein [Alloscardovia venturai]|uniref:histidine kinase n=1 Tax=Alloscardovia venturai TaxID=1769421 RepID=A0ABW2Y5X3_9BIFI
MRVFSHSLRAWAAAVSIIVVFLLTIATSLIAMGFLRQSMLSQVQSQSFKDFSQGIERVQAKEFIDESSADAQRKQSFLNDIVSDLQNSGAANLVGVYMWQEKFASQSDIVPISTDPTYMHVVSSEMKNRVATLNDANILSQPVNLGERKNPIPGNVYGSSLQLGGIGRVYVYGLYSYESAQETLEKVRISLVVPCVIFSIIFGLITWKIMGRIINPVRKVACVARQLSQGNLEARVQVDRQDEIGVLQKSFNDTAETLVQKIDELKKSESMQKRFVSDVSHELRTPVTTIRMASDFLQTHSSAFDETTARTITLLNKQVDNFEKLLTQLLDLSRYDAQKVQTNFTLTDICGCVKNVITATLPLAHNARTTVNCTYLSREAFAYVDSVRVERIIYNIVINAIDFCKHRPIEIGVKSNEDYVAIRIRDYGIGIAQDNLSHIFDRFWRADPSRARVTGGTGLGLSIAREDAKLHRGDIAVRSIVGKGTEFIVVLPVSRQTNPVNISMPQRWPLWFDDIFLDDNPISEICGGAK